MGIASMRPRQAGVELKGTVKLPFGEVPATDGSLDNGVCVLQVKGEIDLASAPALRSALVRLHQVGNRRFVLNLSGVSHLDSTGLGVLVAFSRTLDGAGQIAIAAPPRKVSALLRATGLDHRFPIFRSVDEAIAGCQA